MTTKETDRMAKRAEKCLQQAVREEITKKALLGQYVIIRRNGKTCKVPAKEALKLCKRK